MTATKAAVCGAGVTLALLAGCTTTTDDNAGGNDAGGSASASAAKKLTVWTLEDVQDRIQKTKQIAAAFTTKSGIAVNVVPIAEDQFDQVVTSAAASGKLPDIIAALSLAGVQSLSVNELLDTTTPGQIVDDLGADTFSKAALDLTKDGDTQLAVPSDAWSQLLYYRKDLFKAAGLDTPDTFDKISAAAKALNKPGMAGIALSTTPGDAFTQQSFEYLALGDDCQLVDDSGKVQLTSSNCVDSFSLYDTLARDYSVKGNQDVDTTRATYFAGKSAMVIWSSFLLDELAGLRKDALPTCAQCRADKGFLAKNTGVVGPVAGPDGSPQQFGEVVSWTLTKTANGPAAKQFVEYMMNEGYVDWLGLAPEGKVPVRQGTADDPQKFVKAWGDLKAGVDTKAPLSQFYGQDVISTIVNGPDKFARWGFPQGQGALVGATLGELPVPKAISAMVNGTKPEDAAKQAQSAVEEIASSLK